MNKICFTLILIQLLISSCKKEESLPEYNTDPIVTAYLYSNLPFYLHLEHQKSTSSQTYVSPGLDSLDITITTGKSVHHLLTMGGGVYTDSTLNIVAGNQYDLSFIYNGKLISASTIIPSKPENVEISESKITVTQVTSTTNSFPPGGQVTPVSITWTNSDASYYLTVVKNMESNLVRTDLTIDSTDTTLVFRNKPIIKASDEINTQSLRYYGKHRIILYHINPDYASLYNESNSSSQNLSTPSKGITNGVGIFTGVNADTLYLQVNKK